MNTYVSYGCHKLILNLMEKNRFVCKCISLSSINHVVNCSFSEEENRGKHIYLPDLIMPYILLFKEPNTVALLSLF